MDLNLLDALTQQGQVRGDWRGGVSLGNLSRSGRDIARRLSMPPSTSALSGRRRRVPSFLLISIQAKKLTIKPGFRPKKPSAAPAPAAGNGEN
jgi:hypothetical protein